MSAPADRARALVAHLTGSAAQPQPALRSNSTAVAVQEQCENAPAYDGKYKYTLDPRGALTDAQREQYDRDGFLLVRGIVSPDEIEVWRQRFVAIANGEIDASHMLVMRDVAIAKKKEKGEKAITKLQDWRQSHAAQARRSQLA